MQLGKEDLNNFLESVYSKQGEGVILRKPDSKYEPGRSHQMFRYKVIRMKIT